ncbi:MGDG synthase family glycosyltransferase [Paenibacillus sp. YYML68]|uniref:MGDG synthase family glycosyltransferase n=1 Tax=Paenibacillus sp. YYML68 TaxID=2909250 RepID=UPI00248FBA34|nr:glycosyltransferase [Paenibacillus sp. YYML68]
MHKLRNILILTASYGDGHMQVSKVLKQKFEQAGFRSVRLIDLFEEAHPLMNTVSKFLYMNSGALSAYGLDYYGWSYYLTRDMKPGSVLARCLNVLGIHKLIKVIMQEEPDVLISTFPFGGISEQLERRCISIPTYTILTDFVVHNRWLYSIPEQFYVATNHLRDTMVERGIDQELITVSGIPIREPFYRTKRVEASAAEEPSILLMAGGYGVLRDMKKMTEQLLTIPSVRLNVVCGRNAKLLEELNDCFASEQRVSVYGFVDNIHELMSRSSCVVTKAGGITLSEAIHVNVPILIFKPFPGQEKENAAYLAEQGAAFISCELEELLEQARSILHDQSLQHTMRERARSLQNEYAADRIVRDVTRKLTEGNQAQEGSSA